MLHHRLQDAGKNPLLLQVIAEIMDKQYHISKRNSSIVGQAQGARNINTVLKQCGPIEILVLFFGKETKVQVMTYLLYVYTWLQGSLTELHPKWLKNAISILTQCI